MPEAKLQTIRHSFSLCAVGHDIYVVGGFNYREGVLRKCEKLTISRDTKLNRYNYIQGLKTPTSHCVCSSFNDRYIFKLGGLTFYGEPAAKEN